MLRSCPSLRLRTLLVLQSGGADPLPLLIFSPCVAYQVKGLSPTNHCSMQPLTMQPFAVSTNTLMVKGFYSITVMVKGFRGMRLLSIFTHWENFKKVLKNKGIAVAISVDSVEVLIFLRDQSIY